jgi:hypothetical protein
MVDGKDRDSADGRSADNSLRYREDADISHYPFGSSLAAAVEITRVKISRRE